MALPVSRKLIVDTVVDKKGVKPTLQFYINKAFKASQRAKTDLTSNNTASLAANTQTMIENIEMIRLILSDETKTL